MNLQILNTNAKVNRELTSVRANLTSTNVHEGYLIHCKLKINSTLQDTEESNVLQWEPCHNDNEVALASAAAALSLLSLPTDNSNHQQFNNSHMKCYYDHTHMATS